MCCPLPLSSPPWVLTRSLGSRMETDLPSEAPLPSSWAKPSPELGDSARIAKPYRFNGQWQNTHPSLSLLLEQCSSPLSLLHLPGKPWKSESQWKSLLTVILREQPWPRTARRAESSFLSLLYSRPTSLNPQDCLPMRFWILLLHNNQAILAEAQTTIAVDQL